MKLPQAKSKSVVMQSAGKELLVYDLITNKAYNLNETASIVFNACGSQSSFDELKEKYDYTDDLINLTLAELRKNDLIEGEEGNHYPLISRREAARRVGLGTMIALPLITSLVAPAAAMAVSCVGSGGAVNRTETSSGVDPSVCFNNLKNQCCSRAIGPSRSGCNGATCDCDSTCA